MKIARISFSHKALRKLPLPEQLFFLRLAHVRNDMRQINMMCMAASAAVPSLKGAAKEVGLHQMLFTLRLSYGTLSEAWKMIDSCWNGDKLGQTMGKRLSPTAAKALRSLAQYFGGRNLVRTVRNAAAFHYGADGLEKALSKYKSSHFHDFVSGRIEGNVFYSFAEEAHTHALIGLTGAVDEKGVREFFDETHRKIYPVFADFADGVLTEIVANLGCKIRQINVVDVGDPRACSPAIFVDEPLCLRLATEADRKSSHTKLPKQRSTKKSRAKRTKTQR